MTASSARRGAAGRAGLLRRTRLAAVPLAGILLVTLASPALAQIRDAGDEPGPQFSTLQYLLLYVAAPVSLFLVISLLVAAPSLVRGPRYRPGLSWWAEPVWFGGPAEPEVALATATPTREGGNFSARW